MSSGVMPWTSPAEKARSMNLSSRLTTVLQQSTMSSATAGVTAPVSWLKAW